MTLSSLNTAIKFPKLPSVISSAAGSQRWSLKPNKLFYLSVSDDGADLHLSLRQSFCAELTAVAGKTKGL